MLRMSPEESLRPAWVLCRLIVWAMPLALLGCYAQRPDIETEATRLTGVENAIVFREAGAVPSTAPADGDALSPAQSVRLALSHDPRLQAALARVRVAEAEANQARLLPNPILTIDVRFPQAAGVPTAFETTLGGDIMAILQKPGLIAAADHRLRGSAGEALTVALDLISEVQLAYASARSVDQEIGNAQRRTEILERLRAIAQKRLEAGDATRLDVLTLDAQIMDATLEVANLQQERTEHRLLLARLIGQPAGSTDWKLVAWEAPPATALPPESAWLATALANRPEIASRVWELKALGADLSAAVLTPLIGTEVGGHWEHDGEWRRGPSLSVPLPIFDFGQANRAKIEAMRIAARHELAEQQAEVIQDVRLAFATYTQSREILHAAQTKLLPLQQRQLEQTQLAYQAGEVDLATLLLAQTNLHLTLSRIVELQEKVTVARVKLERAAGGAGIAARLEAAATRPSEPGPATGAVP